MTKTGCGLRADLNSQYCKPPPVLKMLSQREVKQVLFVSHLQVLQGFSYTPKAQHEILIKL